MGAVACEALVILGVAGAGKSSAASLLVESLLSRRAPGAVVPILLSASNWDPYNHTLVQWVAKELLEQYGFLQDKRCLVTDLLVEPAGFGQPARAMLWRWAIPDTASASVLAARR